MQRYYRSCSFWSFLVKQMQNLDLRNGAKRLTPNLCLETLRFALKESKQRMVQERGGQSRNKPVSEAINKFRTEMKTRRIQITT